MTKKITWKIVFLTLVMAMLCSSVIGVPIPLGIDGRVYELDGVTEVFSGVPVIINDTTSGIVINTTTGAGTSGRYSAVINGNSSDVIIVTVYNPIYSTSRNITLTGVIHDFDLILNMSLPPFSPKITSTPGLTVNENQQYVYSLDGFDWNGDDLTYSLVEKPSGMSVTGNLITWIPKNGDVGFHDIIVSASDGNLTGEQQYTLEVINVNNPPEITSEPKISVKLGQKYKYNVVVKDPDDISFIFSLNESPGNMTISSSGVVEWLPEEIGDYDVTIVVSDGEFVDSQAYTIGVGKKPKPRKSPGGSGGAGGAGGSISKGKLEDYLFGDDKKGEEGEDEGESGDTPVLDIKFKGPRAAKTRIRSLEKRPDKVKKISRIVYKYLEIEKIQSDETGDALVSFKVRKNWLKERSIKKDDVILSRYTNFWEDLPTRPTEEDEENSYYEAETPGFSYFAITVREEAETKLPEPTIAKIKEPFVIFGTITNRWNSEVPAGTPVIIENLDTQQIIYMETGGPSTGSYQVVLHGAKGNRVKIIVQGYYEKEIDIVLKESKLRVDIDVRAGGGLLGITGRMLGVVTGKNISNVWAFFVLVILVIVLFLVGYGLSSGLIYEWLNKKPDGKDTLEELINDEEFQLEKEEKKKIKKKPEKKGGKKK